jgi:hypothetical protein
MVGSLKEGFANHSCDQAFSDLYVPKINALTHHSYDQAITHMDRNRNYSETAKTLRLRRML